MICACASAQVALSPATRPSGVPGVATTRPSLLSATAPATQPTLESMHAQAVALMAQGRYDKAAPLLEKVYAAIPRERQTRSLVINHAILDMTQRINVMRGVKDLSEYLLRNKDADEYATDVLGSAMNVAAERPAWKKSAVWQAAYREWNKRNFELDHSRPGYHRWGTQWLDEDQFRDVQAKRDAWQRALRDQEDRVKAAAHRAQALADASQQAWGDAQMYENLRSNLEQIYVDPRYAPMSRSIAGGQAVNARWEALAAKGTANQLSRDAQGALAQISMEQVKLTELQRQEPRPDWPKRFEPVPPGEVVTTRPATLAPTTGPTGSATTTTTTTKPSYWRR
jgi:hypothetical protein